MGIQYTLARRRAAIGQLRSSGTFDYQYPLPFQGQVKTYPVYTVEIDMPCYRVRNGRTRAAQLEIVATEQLADDFFSADPDSEPALKKQDAILRKMVSEAGLLRIFKKVQQDQPLILDNDGYIVNGNRRVCAMRLLLEQDSVAYSHFAHVQVLILPPCSERDIKELEGRLQVQPDIRADFSWTAEAMLYRDLRSEQWSDEQIADLYKKKVPEVRELIGMLEDAEHYLGTRDLKGRYSSVLKKEYAFRQLQKSRRKCDSEPKKLLLNNIAYLMLDDPDTGEGRLYENIPDAMKYLDRLAAGLRVEFADEIAADPPPNDNLGILGGSSADVYAEVSRVLATTQRAAKARDVIRDSIQEMQAVERERKDASFCLRQVQQAYTRLQSALSALSADTDATGIEGVLKNIDEAVSDVRDWLSDGSRSP